MPKGDARAATRRPKLGDRSAVPAVLALVVLLAVVAEVLALGLVLAVATDGRLPAVGTYALFGALAALDGLAIAWLTRPRGA